MNVSLEPIIGDLQNKRVRFFIEENGGKNQDAQLKLLNAQLDSKVKINSFEESNLDFRSFEWKDTGQDRNWWWQMQALPFLGWFVASRELFSFEQKLAAAEFCKTALINWIEIIPESNDKTLRWHDHASSFRLTNIFNWLVSIKLDDELTDFYSKLDTPYSFYSLLEKHITWLSEDENYSKHTNHGLDQATSVMMIGLYTSYEAWDSYFQLAEERLIEELDFAFTEEGVHKENSPGYHAFMLRRIKKFSGLGALASTPVIEKANQLEQKATHFLEAITLPDGFLPMIGDTRGGQEGIKVPLSKTLAVYDYSKSGYVIVKGLVNSKPVYLLVKNCFDSHYHRHDDDLHIFLYYDGRILLGDGGLGAHNEKDPRRVALRGRACHNVPSIKEMKATRDRAKVQEVHTLSVNKDEIVGYSSIYAHRIARKVDFSALSSGILRIVDECNTENATVVQNFMFPEAYLSTQQESKRVLVTDKLAKVLLQISVESSTSNTFEHILKEMTVPYSEKYGKYEERTGIEIEYRAGDKAIVTITF